MPPGAKLVRVYLTQWAQTSQGGMADAEVLCRFYAEVRIGDQEARKLGPFFTRGRYDPVTTTQAHGRWAQYQAVAREAIEVMAANLSRDAGKPGGRKVVAQKQQPIE